MTSSLQLVEYVKRENCSTTALFFLSIKYIFLASFLKYRRMWIGLCWLEIHLAARLLWFTRWLMQWHSWMSMVLLSMKRSSIAQSIPSPSPWDSFMDSLMPYHMRFAVVICPSTVLRIIICEFYMSVWWFGIMVTALCSSIKLLHIEYTFLVYNCIDVYKYFSLIEL